MYKDYFRRNNNGDSGWGVPSSDKADFLKDIPKIREDTFKQLTIRTVFADRGIYPWNPSKILHPTIPARSPTPELQIVDGDKSPSNSSVSSTSPPQNVEGLQQSISKLKRYQEENSELFSESYLRRAERVYEAAVREFERCAEFQLDNARHAAYDSVQPDVNHRGGFPISRRIDTCGLKPPNCAKAREKYLDVDRFANGRPTKTALHIGFGTGGEFDR